MKKLIKTTKKKAQKTNRGGTKIEYDGIKFRSKLEAYCYKKLKEANIYAEYEQHRYTLLPNFKFDNKTIRAITYLPDFVGKNFVIECKGYANESFPLREKLFKYYLTKNEPHMQYFLVKTQKQIDALIDKLKQ